jgi:hypothetical protein
MHDRHQFVKRPATEVLSKPDQPPPLLRRDRDSSRQLTAQDLILGLQISARNGLTPLRRADDQQQESEGAHGCLVQAIDE